jgi:uncharacterized protein
MTVYASLTHSSQSPLEGPDFDELDAILDDMRQRFDETPQWEFCEGALAALICCRRVIEPTEYFALLLGLGEEEGAAFADEGQAQRFMGLWQQRWWEVTNALDNPVESLEDEAAFQPQVMDVRGAVAALPPEELTGIAPESLPSFAQVWALGFMFVVENWPDQWASPRRPLGPNPFNDALNAIVVLTEDDEAKPTLSIYSADGPPTVSTARLEAFGAAIWGVYELRRQRLLAAGS